MRTPWKVIGVASALVLSGSSCASETTSLRQGQILLYVDTDAPLPAGPDENRSLALPLFDRLRVEIFRPGETTPCSDCVNEFEMNTSFFEQRKASFGIAPPLHVGGFRARIRLFKADFADQSGEPNAVSTLETVVSLPVVDTNDVLERTAFLTTENVGVPQGTLALPIEPSLGAPEGTHVDTWPGAARLNCTLPQPSGGVCVPGGAYWMGPPNAPGFTPPNYVLEPRLVVLSPFYVSAAEVTVRELRAKGVPPKHSWSGSSQGISSSDWCTFTVAPGRWEGYPINCLTVAEARVYCVSLGGDLPTEAQFEYLQGGLAGNLFPWGHDAPSCTDAIFGRGGYGLLAGAVAPCMQPPPPGSPALPGSGERDRLNLPGGTIFDLAGNVTEWTRDSWNRFTEPCWSRIGVYRDPLCTTPSPADGALGVHRGGNWAEAPDRMVASARFPLDPAFQNINTGFRCVWPAR